MAKTKRSLRTRRVSRTRQRAQAAHASLRDATKRGSEIVHMAAEQVENTSGRFAETVAPTAESTLEARQRQGDRVREMIEPGAEIARIMDIYRQAIGIAAGNSLAMLGAYLSLVRCFQAVQQSWLRVR
jgi:hypothetical protein